MSQIKQQAPVNRRGFLKTALAMTAGAVTASAGTAHLMSQQGPTVIRTYTPSNSLTNSLPNITQLTSHTSAQDLQQQLIAAHAENMRLQTQLDLAQQRINSLQTQTAQPDALVQALQDELASSRLQLGSLAGLVSLYDQLDSLDLDQAVGNGLAMFSGSVAMLAGQLPTLHEALQTGQNALSDFENQIPLVDNGRQWLSSHLGKLTLRLQSLETSLQNAVDNMGPVLQMLNDWFQNVLSWLPFGMGNKASRVVASITDIINEIPNTLSGLYVNVSQPLELWLRDEAGEKPLMRHLVRPLREQTIASANGVAQQAQQVHTHYQTELAQPTQTLIQHREQVRSFIKTYRQEHNI